MKNIASRLLALAAIALVATLTPEHGASAEEPLQRTESFNAWSVFVDEAAPQKYCYAATVPSSTRASRQGIRRGDVFLIVSTFPAANVENEISVKLGFPADPNRPPMLQVGSQQFKMFSDDQEAWLEDPSVDRQVVAAMRQGNEAVITSTSTRGTVLTDTFSLIGFTAAVTRVAEVCQ